MKVLVQWATDPPQDWEEIDSADWSSLPKGPEPTGGEIITSERLWIHRVNIQGVLFSGDHYAVVNIAQGVRVSIWNDDPEDWPDEDYHAQVWQLLTPKYDNKVGVINTRQQFDFYSDNEKRRSVAPQERRHVRPWRSFQTPPPAYTRHGIWVPDELDAALAAARAKRFWMEWIEE